SRGACSNSPSRRLKAMWDSSVSPVERKTHTPYRSMASTMRLKVTGSTGREKSTPETSATKEGPAVETSRGAVLAPLVLKPSVLEKYEACFHSSPGCSTVANNEARTRALRVVLPDPTRRSSMRAPRAVASAVDYKILKIRPLTGALGAEISGIDLSQ